MIGVPLLKDQSHVPRIYWVIDLSHTYSLYVSWIASISSWLDGVETNVCFIDLYDVTVLPHVKRKSVWDQSLYG
jgi:hypothetical protein